MALLLATTAARPWACERVGFTLGLGPITGHSDLKDVTLGGPDLIRRALHQDGANSGHRDSKQEGSNA